MSSASTITAEAAEALAPIKIRLLFFYIMSYTNVLMKFPKFRDYALQKGLSKLMEQIGLILKNPDDPTEALRALQISEAELNVVTAIVLKMIEASCLGFISKQSNPEPLSIIHKYVLRMINLRGWYESVVIDSLTEFVIEFDDKTVNRTFFEQKMLELMPSSE
jgi:hypothetical protein